MIILIRCLSGVRHILVSLGVLPAIIEWGESWSRQDIFGEGLSDGIGGTGWLSWQRAFYIQGYGFSPFALTEGVGIAQPRCSGTADEDGSWKLGGDAVILSRPVSLPETKHLGGCRDP